MKKHFLFGCLLLMHAFSCIFSSETKDLVMIYHTVKGSLEFESSYNDFIKEHGICSPYRLAELAPVLAQVDLRPFGCPAVFAKRQKAISFELFSEGCLYTYGFRVDPEKVYVYNKNFCETYRYIESKMTLFAYLKVLKKNHDEGIYNSDFGMPIFDRDGRIINIRPTRFLLRHDEETNLAIMYDPEILVDKDCIPYLELFTIK